MATFTERFGFRKASGVGEAGWGHTLFAAVISFIYFLPVLIIIFTAFKPAESGAVRSADLVAHFTLWLDPRPVCIFPDAGELWPGLLPRHDSGRTAGGHRL